MLYAHQNFPGVQRVTVAGYRRPQSARVRSIYAKQGVDGIEENCRWRQFVKSSQQNQEILSWIIGVGSCWILLVLLYPLVN